MTGVQRGGRGKLNLSAKHDGGGGEARLLGSALCILLVLRTQI